MKAIKSVAITGATGMIGATLIEEFVKNNINVIAIIRPNSPKRCNIPNHKLVEIIECSIDEICNIEISQKRCDVFYHFAWNGPFGDSRNNYYLQNENIKYTLDAVRLAHLWGCHTFIGAGSQAEYGRSIDDLSPNTPICPENGYGIAKYAAGKLSALYAEKLNLRHIWGRILSTYGPMDNDYTLVMSLLNKFIQGEKPFVTNGDQMWDYLYSEDAARAFYLLGHYGKNKSIYCIGSGKSKPLKEYIQDIRNSVNPSLQIGFGEIPYSEKQVMNLKADITNLSDDTGFFPKVTFSDGISNTLKWIKEKNR